MIKAQGQLTIAGGHSNTSLLLRQLKKLPDGDYLYLLCNKEKNRNLPYLKYLFSVVLKYISDNLPGHPNTTALYKFFEGMFAPTHAVEINGKQFEYCELKSEKSADVNNIIEKIVEYALNEWNIEVPRTEEFSRAENVRAYSQAYLEQEVDWSSFISSHQTQSKDERRKEIERF